MNNETVSIATIAAVLVTLAVSTILPIAVYLIYGMKHKGKGVWTAWLIGAAGFFVPQILIRIPILNLLSLNKGFTAFAEKNYVLYCFALAFSAALFEAAGRYAAAKVMHKNLTVERGIAAGLGHGGIEAILVVGMTYVNNLIYIVMINVGIFDSVVEQAAATGADTGALAGVKEALLHTDFSIFLLAGYERILTMTIHVALTLIVFYFVRKKKDAVGIILCLVCHTIVDFVAPVVSGMAGTYLGGKLSIGTAYVIIYAFLTAAATAGILVVAVLRKKWRVQEKGAYGEEG